MAVLADNDRGGVNARIQSDWSSEREQVAGVTKADIRAAINALDDFMNANAAVINTAIPQPARSALTARQKARLLVYVIRRRFEVA